MGDSGKLTRRAALGLVAAGGALLSHQSLGFSSLSADRFTQIDLADDETAFLSIAGQSAEETPTFTNRADSNMDVTLSSDEPSAEFDVDGDGNSESLAEFELADGETREVEMNAEVSEITVDVHASFGSGTITLDRLFEIPQAGQVDITATVESTGASGQFAFGMWNDGSIDAEMVSIRVDETTTNASEVADGDIFRLDESENADEDPRQLISSALDIDEELPLTPFDDEDSVVLNQEGDELVFLFDRFKNPPGPGSPNADMRGETVFITVGFGDGSQGSFELED